MTINANVTEFNDVALAADHSAENSEASTVRGFFAIVGLALVSMVGAGALFGLGGVGDVAIAEALSMLIVCIFLTRG